ncbi:ABC transporter permease subunit [Phyllobacterium endophyticum]|uniref:sn-glycerol-3-phosphate transport system permease protein UgpE n=1 Tax=Phyllobacterium endophyticum TaxID=1149773 RepID=A0A2P7AQU0_9HYPH|nr:ABC transporter permease subunit [Phyllobacterium endophyticum]MBB3237226.1 sn-glycerol 3-phosphate transport system permease protein [Phyllobacterium endophyticum]PSH56605.1 ABC transporter permease [Phyllobacterium endophyticum]TYR44401.1 ABC transporter permease subunit [Phyllobacterium endophyticum]
MIENTRTFDHACGVILIIGIAAVCFPIYYAFIAASMPPGSERDAAKLIPGPALFQNLEAAWINRDLGRQLFNSLIMAAGITVGKLFVSILSAFAIVYFRFRFRMIAFYAIFITLMLPIEVRIGPTYSVAANILDPVISLSHVTGLNALISMILGRDFSISAEWSLLDSYPGLILPLIASATGTFLFRQFFMTIPPELCEAAQLDGAGPIRFLWSILLPMSRTPLAALSVIVFIYGWNQYLWPLLITTDPAMTTALIGIAKSLPSSDAEAPWSITMAGALIVTFPPVLVVLVLQRWFVRGLVESEK